MERYRIAVGHNHEVQPGNIVGAIASEAGLDGEHIGHIDIHDDFSLVDLPAGMPKDIFQDLKKAWVCGQKMNITRLSEASPVQRNSKSEPGRKPKKEGKKTTKRKPKKKDKKDGKDNKDS
jgi:ATP-dependent RNA helicase DeaD